MLWVNLVQIVGLFVAIGALILGFRQLRYAAQATKDAAQAAKDAAQATKETGLTVRVQVVLGLDERLSAFEDVREELNKSQPHITDKVRLRRYIAAFERVGYALRLERIYLEEADQFYGDRFLSLTKYQPALDIVKYAKDPEAWKEFYYLWGELYGYKGNKRKLEPPQSSR